MPPSERTSTRESLGDTMKNGAIDLEELKSRLRAPLLADGRLRLAVLFGSAAAGKAHAASDIDVAFTPMDADRSLDAELRLQGELTRAAGRNVDLVRLDLASTLVRWEALRNGVLLFESGPFEFARARAAAASEYLDFAPALAAATERYRRAIANPPAERKAS